VAGQARTSVLRWSDGLVVRPVQLAGDRQPYWLVQAFRE
jgi:hypothetical protein